MQKYIEQARHNEEFYKCIDSNFAEKFYDWKITVLFYTAIHCLKALAISRGINIGDTHKEIESNVNPTKSNAKMRITTGAWREYRSLYEYSRTARYNGIIDLDTFEEIKKIDHDFCLTHLSNFKKYVSSQGVEL